MPLAVSTKLSNLDLIDKCDNFPYHESEPDRYNEAIAQFYQLQLVKTNNAALSIGYIPTWVVQQMQWNHEWHVDHTKKTISCKSPDDISGSIARLLDHARAQKLFKVLDGWRDELYAITHQASIKEQIITIERSGSPLFGVNTYGVHLTMYVKSPSGLRFWIPRRARSKQTYGGMLDNTVAGGLTAGETPFECLVREAAEEASLPEDLVRANAKACGTVSYFHIRDAQAGGEEGLCQPECQFVYDLEVGVEIEPRTNDDEVEAFHLMSLEQTRQALYGGNFKPNCALILLDFFIRHGLLKPEGDADFAEIVARLHRRLPFPTK